MDCRTASSNSMGPGMRRVLWAGCEDILFLVLSDCLGIRSESIAGGVRWIGLYSRSSGSTDSLSDEKGVFSSGNGSRWSKCLAMRDRRALPLPLPLPRPECDASLAADGIGGQEERWPRQMRSIVTIWWLGMGR
ncbi:hypothetical protein TMatcc_004020 [Talaromyces marneffei ATCC 18224]